MDFYGGMLPNIKNCPCDSISRNSYFTECIPLYNMISSEKNLVFEENNIIYTIFYNSNDSETYIVNQFDGIIDESQEKTRIISEDMSFNDKKNDYVNKILQIDNVKIPLYYMYINNDDVFNILLSSDSKILKDLFRFTDTKKFVGMSITFNIFNISLFTHTFFDILKIFIFYFNKKDKLNLKIKSASLQEKKTLIKKFSQIENDIKKMLLNIYDNKREYLTNIYDLYYYKKKILTKNNDERKNFLDSPINCDENNISFSDYDRIIQSTAQNLVNIADLIHDFSESIDYKQYKYIFLVSLLSYRLKNKTITGGWGFSVKKTCEQLESLFISKVIDKRNTNIFIESVFPPIYEYSMTTFRGITYGNCMENTILQFMKIIFWSIESQRYAINVFSKIIKDKYVDKFTYFFNNIAQEKNATFDNLFLACFELFKNDGNISEYNDINKKNNFLKEKNQQIGLSVIDISTINYGNTDVIKLKTRGREFQITLNHNMHAFFNDALIGNMYSILNNISVNANINKTLHAEHKIQFDKEIKQLVLLKILFNPENENIYNKLYYDYIYKNDFYLLDNTMKSIFSDNRNRSDLLDKCTDILFNKDFINKNIVWKHNIKYISPKLIIDNIDNTFFDLFDVEQWEYILENYDDELFWIKLTDILKGGKIKILEQWNITYDFRTGNILWFLAFKNIKSEEFWEYISENNIEFFKKYWSYYDTYK